jgi:hypothetical protein
MLSGLSSNVSCLFYRAYSLKFDNGFECERIRDAMRSNIGRTDFLADKVCCQSWIGQGESELNIKFIRVGDADPPYSFDGKILALQGGKMSRITLQLGLVHAGTGKMLHERFFNV